MPGSSHKNYETSKKCQFLNHTCSKQILHVPDTHPYLKDIDKVQALFTAHTILVSIDKHRPYHPYSVK